jgi:hypothetical protein
MSAGAREFIALCAREFIALCPHCESVRNPS